MNDTLRGFDKRSRNIICTATNYGWTGRVTSKGHYLMRSPEGSVQITVPSKMEGKPRVERNALAPFKKWMREHNPEATNLIDLAYDALDDVRPDPDDPETVIAKGSASDIITASILQAAASKKMRPVPKETAVPTITESRPWLAKKQPSPQGGSFYPSPTTNERLWSDGTIDYACTFSGCDFTAPAPRSVARHYGAGHTRKGEAEPARTDEVIPGVDYTQPTTTRDYQPTERLIAALAAFLAQSVSNGSTDREIAEAALAWFHDRPDLGDAEAREARPLTDSEIVARIRALVWSPIASDLADAKARAEQAIRERDEANARLVAVERDLDAFRELAQTIGRSPAA